MEGAFGTVIIVVSIVAAVAAIVIFLSSSGIYDDIGKGDFALDVPDLETGPAAGSAQERAEATAEIRQFLEARAARAEARGEKPVDIEAEMAALAPKGAGGMDEALREEVRQLVGARNERRVARGEDPLDVEAEVDRQLRDLGA